MTVTPHDAAYFIILKITKHCGIETLTRWNIRNCWVNPQKPLQWNHPHSELGWVSLEEKKKFPLITKHEKKNNFHCIIHDLNVYVQ